MKPFFVLIGMQFTFQSTNYAYSLPFQVTRSGHAEDLGISFDPKAFDSVLFISGDGTINEFINGVLSRDDARSILVHATFGAIPAGSQNSFARGMGTSSIYTALYCLVKRKVRLYDGVCVENGDRCCRYAFAGCGWGILSDMVKDYERYRCLRSYRYWLLKGIHGFFCLRRHYCCYRYVPDENQVRFLCSHKYPVVRTKRCLQRSVRNAQSRRSASRRCMAW